MDANEQRALDEFTEYFVKNYPGPNTIIGDPNWHAPRIFRAAKRALAQQVPADGVLTNPYTGTPRDYRDVESDPAGILIVEPGAPLLAATPQAPQPVVDGDVARALEWVREVGAPFTQEERAMLDCIEEAIAAYDPSQVGARTVKREESAMDLPDRLRLVGGEVVLADGGDVRAYLQDFARKAKIDPDTPVALMSHHHVRLLEAKERMAGLLASPA